MLGLIQIFNMKKKEKIIKQENNLWSSDNRINKISSSDYKIELINYASYVWFLAKNYD
jgi:hypothetical protein